MRIERGLFNNLLSLALRASDITEKEKLEAEKLKKLIKGSKNPEMDLVDTKAHDSVILWDIKDDIRFIIMGGQYEEELGEIDEKQLEEFATNAANLVDVSDVSDDCIVAGNYVLERAIQEQIRKEGSIPNG